MLGVGRLGRGTCWRIGSRILVCGLEGLLRLSVVPSLSASSWATAHLVMAEDCSRMDLGSEDFVWFPF